MGMIWLNCDRCQKAYCSYPDRKGTSGKHYKFCSRECYRRDVAARKEMFAWQEAEGIKFKVPPAFFDDHEERCCEPACSPFKRTAKAVWLYWNDPGIDELLDDARHYATPGQFGPELLGLVQSARATVKAIEAAREALAKSRERRELAVAAAQEGGER